MPTNYLVLIRFSNNIFLSSVCLLLRTRLLHNFSGNRSIFPSTPLISCKIQISIKHCSKSFTKSFSGFYECVFQFCCIHEARSTNPCSPSTEQKYHCVVIFMLPSTGLEILTFLRIKFVSPFFIEFKVILLALLHYHSLYVCFYDT